MKTPLRITLASALLAVLAMAPAFAQESGVLTFTGNVQVCQSAKAGAICRPAVPNAPLRVGSYLMVGPNATATLTYPESNAVVNFTDPGLYTIKARVGGDAGSYTARSVIASNAAFITFAALIAASGIAASLDDDDDLPSYLVPISP